MIDSVACTSPPLKYRKHQASPSRPGNLKSPLRRKAPSMSPSPSSRRGSCTPRRRRPRGNYLPLNDRYIPNRRHVDGFQCKRHLLNPEGETRNEESPKRSERRKFSRQLRQALCGNNEPSSVLNLPASTTQPLSMALPSGTVDPYQQDVLRSFGPGVLQKRRPDRFVDRHCKKFLSVRGGESNNLDNDLNLITTCVKTTYTSHLGGNAHDTMTFALGRKVVSIWIPVSGKWEKSMIEYIVQDNGSRITSLKWRQSYNKEVVAVGGFRTLSLIEKGEGESWHRRTETLHGGSVTAVEWMEHGLFAADQEAILLIDERFKSHGSLNCCDQRGVTNLKYQQSTNTLACAGRNGLVRVWDVRNFREPLHNLRHDGASGMEYSPGERNVLATGGRDGIKIWDIASGRQTVGISIPHKRVTSLLWSPYRKEILASYDQYLSVWSVSSEEARRLEEWQVSSSHPNNVCPAPYEIVSMDHLSGGRVIAMGVNGRFFDYKVFGDPPIATKKRKMPCWQMNQPPVFSVVR
jgi:WD40 repeat protein